MSLNVKIIITVEIIFKIIIQIFIAVKAYKTIKNKKNMGHLPPFKTAVGRCPLQPAVAAGYSRATARR